MLAEHQESGLEEMVLQVVKVVVDNMVQAVAAVDLVQS
jgi:hypothetical protein